MSHYDYQRSLMIAAQDEPFYAMVMALMRQADNVNFEKLKLAFPEVYRELYERRNAPGGILPGEPGYYDVTNRR